MQESAHIQLRGWCPECGGPVTSKDWWHRPGCLIAAKLAEHGQEHSVDGMAFCPECGKYVLGFELKPADEGAGEEIEARAHELVERWNLYSGMPDEEYAAKKAAMTEEDPWAITARVAILKAVSEDDPQE